MEEARTTPAKHVFLDVVEFTRNRSVEAQTEIVGYLNSFVADCLEQHDPPENKRILLPTGDGLCIALLNIEDPYDIHVQLALSILKTLHRHNADSDLDESRHFDIRIGINANTDNLVTDVNGRLNIAGRGINEAQRVMSNADRNQILVSQAVHNTLRDREKYMGLFDRYRAKIKHGEQITVYKLKMIDRPELNSETPSIFSTPTAQEPRLDRLLAYYIAHATQNRRTILDKNLSDDNAVTTLLYFLAEDSEEAADATEMDTLYPRTYKAGQATFEEQYAYYAQIDREVLWALDRFIANKYFYNSSNHRYFHNTSGGWTDFRFASDAGKRKLKEDWPHIWEQFGLDEQPSPVS